MREAEKKRLIELIKQGDKAFADKYTGEVMSHIDELYEFIADHLLENGVIVSPCKVGDVVFRVTELVNGESFVQEGVVIEIASTYENEKTRTRFYFMAKGEVWDSRHYSLWCDLTDFGKNSFPTKAEAEYALKNRRSVSLIDGHIEE